MVSAETSRTEGSPSLNPLFIRSSIPFGAQSDRDTQCNVSQSLIHQVIYSVARGRFLSPRSRRVCLNPLFIRSSIPLIAKLGTPASRELSQSLIHQVIYSVPNKWICLTTGLTLVSIPYSSGHLFRWGRMWNGKLPFHFAVSIPYSSGHLFRCGVTEAAAAVFSQRSQSLIHQVIYSVRRVTGGGPRAPSC